MKLKIITIIAFIISIGLFSCNGVKTEEDKFPEIPKFPLFKNNDLKLEKKIELIAKTDSTIFYQEYYYMHKRFLVKDSTFFLITYLTDFDDPERPFEGRKYLINLLTIKNGKINLHSWIDYDFKLIFDIDKKNDNLMIGKRKYYAKSNYLKYDSISNTNNFKIVDSIFYDGFFNLDCINDRNFIYPDSFDSVIIDSKLKSGAVMGSTVSIFTWQHVPIYLNYYKIKYKNKIGLTKSIDSIQPIFVKLKDDLYYIEDKYLKINDKNRIQKIIIYKIQ